ncbi:MAG TPA: hypothetical protein VEQ63_15925, partial [Bryobacteraceae bacterium]|nr:hypothetical protein [Bryobacteraceae bacterium]
IDFLCAWILIFFAAALVLFFAGSARYLLPIASPLAILVSEARKLVVPAFFWNLALGLGLATVNFQHWSAYRDFTNSLKGDIAEKRVWINGELGMRFYLESAGALPLPKGRVLRAGEWVVSSELAFAENVTAPLALISAREIWPNLPLRIIGLGSRSGYSSASFGLRPFDIRTGSLDRVRAEAVLERKPTLSYLPMNAPEAQVQIVSGVYNLEQNAWRWAGPRAVLMLKAPPEPLPLHIKLFVPDMSPARRLRVLLDNELVHEQTFPAAGTYTIVTPRALGATVVLQFDKTFSVPPDRRDLAAIISEIGFR